MTKEILEEAVTNVETGAFKESDIWALTTPKPANVSKTFRAKGRDWKFGISTLAKTQAEVFYKYTALIDAAKAQKESETVLTPMGEKVIVAPGAYLGMVRVLSAVCVEPKLSVDALLTLGHHVGGLVMDDILGWMSKENGMSPQLIEGEIDEKKKLESATA